MRHWTLETGEGATMSDYDSPWKEALDEYFEPFMAFFFPQAHAEIDWGRGFEFLDKELQQIMPEAEIGRRTVDKLVKVWLTSGEEQWVLIHIELQMTEEAVFPRRMYIYNYRSFDKYNREVVSFAVLGDDNPRWRPDNFSYDRWGCRAGLWFPVVKLLDYAERLEELEENPNPFAVVVLAHLGTVRTRQDQDERYAAKVRLIKGLYRRGLDAVEARRLFRVIDWMMDLPKPLQRTFLDELERFEEEKKMPFMTTPERLGLEKGRLEGIEAALEIKFGEEGLRLMPEIRELDDNDKLKAILRTIKTAASPEELRRIWASN
jgi:hypothetical protein